MPDAQQATASFTYLLGKVRSQQPAQGAHPPQAHPACKGVAASAGLPEGNPDQIPTPNAPQLPPYSLHAAGALPAAASSPAAADAAGPKRHPPSQASEHACRPEGGLRTCLCACALVLSPPAVTLLGCLCIMQVCAVGLASAETAPDPEATATTAQAAERSAMLREAATHSHLPPSTVQHGS